MNPTKPKKEPMAVKDDLTCETLAAQASSAHQAAARVRLGSLIIRKAVKPIAVETCQPDWKGHLIAA